MAIWDAFSMPKMTYEPQTKSFAFTFDKRRKMNPDAGARCGREGVRKGGARGLSASNFLSVPCAKMLPSP